MEFLKSFNFEISKFSKFDNSENYQSSKNLQFGKLSYILSVWII